MFGPEILARSLTEPSIADKFGNVWQYHSRSDHHSKIACWAVMFDLMMTSALLRAHAVEGKVVFGLNHEMSDFKTRRKKNLDLVIARPATEASRPRSRARRTLASLGTDYGVRLNDVERGALRALPDIAEGPVAGVLVALEAKACMTAHSKARPRLYDELNSSHLTVHGANDQAIAAAFVMINNSATFLSPDRNHHDLSVGVPIVNAHLRQPDVTMSVDAKVRELPTRTRPGDEGYDAVGIVVVDCANDGSPVTIASAPPGPPRHDLFHYDQMIVRIVHQYDFLFAGI
jgi:hypothetical protein